MASKIKVDQIQTADGTGTIALQNQLSGMTTASLPTVTTDKLGAGAIIQVRESSATSTVTVNSGTETDVITLNITPSSSSNAILIMTYGHSGHLGGGGTGRFEHRIRRDSTFVIKTYTERNSSDKFKASADSMTVLDFPNTTSQITYKLTSQRTMGSDTSSYGGSSTYYGITLMEVKQ
jgi:hypothetical protein